MNNEKKTKIDIIGSITDDIGSIATHTSGFTCVAILFGFLFAPIFAPLFENGLKEKYKTKYNMTDYELVRQKMTHIRLVLWCIAIIGWILVFISNLKTY